MGQNINESYYKKPDDDLIKEIADKIPLPYIKELGYYGITEEGEILEILSYIFGKELKRRKNTGHWFTLTDEENRVIYAEVINEVGGNYPLGTWMVYKYEDDRFPKKWTKLISSTGDLTTKEYREDGDVHSTSYGEIEKIPTRITESVDEDRHKRYLDKILKYMMKYTNIDYEQEKVHFFYGDSFRFETLTYGNYIIPYWPLINYCKSQFGLTDEEADELYYVYRSFIESEIKKNIKWD